MQRELKASALLSDVVNCSLLWVKMSGREEPVVFALKNLQKSFGLSLTELARDEILFFSGALLASLKCIVVLLCILM